MSREIDRGGWGIQRTLSGRVQERGSEGEKEGVRERGRERDLESGKNGVEEGGKEGGRACLKEIKREKERRSIGGENEVSERWREPGCG